MSKSKWSSFAIVASALLIIITGTRVAISVSRGDLVIVPLSDSRRDGMVVDAYMGQGDCEAIRIRRWAIFVWHEGVPEGSDERTNDTKRPRSRLNEGNR